MLHLVPGDSRRGSMVFEEKGCASCHQIQGADSGTLPFLAMPEDSPLTEGEIAARLWNHGPRMWDAIGDQGRPAITISAGEMADLFAFLLALSLMESPGDAGLGELLYRQKGCGFCHRPNSRAGAPSLEYWGAHTDPLQLARAMWNHARAMQVKFDENSRPWPRLDGHELAHIVAYVRRVNSIATPAHLTLGSPLAGRTVFKASGCGQCHGAAGEDGRAGPDIHEISQRSTTLAGLAAQMWNHYPEMFTNGHEPAPRWLPLTEGDMADVVAYLFATGYLERAGDPARGRNVFNAKLCAYCHTGQQPAGGNLESFRRRATPAEFACAMWNHGPLMSRWMRQNDVSWPELDRQAIVDLISFLSRQE